ncbi:MAG: tRNA uridine(34) 5-carboxymethylaminomethyl modification radical SAM/GNAT enzyme Elp3 [Candidatus Bilamarchaeaceae archaeon]
MGNMDGKRMEAIAHMLRSIRHGADPEDAKRDACRRFGLSVPPKSTEIIAMMGRTEDAAAGLKRKPVRTISGVSPIAVMIRPDGSCGHACIYCPFTGKAAKSYTGAEPAALRARDNDFDPLRQVRTRIRQYGLNGHPCSKCELILMGGTFLEMPAGYKRGFVKGIYDGLNGKSGVSIIAAQKMNEKAGHRMVGLTVETRPDVCGEKELDEMLSYGCTKIELGVQHPDDGIYRRIRRGHTVSDVVRATKLAKDRAFKLCYHVMPGLPGSDLKKDLKMMDGLFSDARFRPDMLKIYPTLVLEGTGLHRMMRDGEYAPYSAEEAADLIAEAHRRMPKYVRVMRIQRDIPSNLVQGGAKMTNLRQLVERKIKEKGIRPMEIRMREIGFAGENGAGLKTGMWRLDTFRYSASGGEEMFISYERKDDLALAGFIRLRIPPEDAETRREITGRTALVRELHVYGDEVDVGIGAGKRAMRPSKAQHRGIGTLLLSEAERLARDDYGKTKMAILSGVGVREYYRKRGYRKDGPYMSKKLQ